MGSILFLSVRKPRNAKNLEDQVKMVGENIFQKIFRCQYYCKKYLLDDGWVLNLNYGDHKWRFKKGGNFHSIVIFFSIINFKN